MKSRCIPIIITFIIFSGTAPAQFLISHDDFLVAQPLTADQGLESRNITGVAEDDQGFIWIGSIEGLTRYDGSTLKTYSDRNKTLTGLTDNRILCLLIRGKVLWIGTHNGLFAMDLITERVTPYLLEPGDSTGVPATPGGFSINVLYTEPDGTLWVGTPMRGFYRFHEETQDFTGYRVDEKDIPAFITEPLRMNAIMDFQADRSDPDILWVGLFSGLLKFNKRTATYTLYCFPFPDAEYQLHHNACRRIFQYTDGKIYIGAWHYVFQCFDPETEELKIILDNTTADKARQPSIIKRMIYSDDGVLWITSNTGLHSYHFDSGVLKPEWINDEINNTIFGVDFIDHFGRKYVTYSQGLMIYDPLQQNFKPYSFAALAPSASGQSYDASFNAFDSTYYVTSVNATGLYKFNPRTQSWHVINIPPSLMRGDPNYLLRNTTRLNDHVTVVVAINSLLLYDDHQGKFEPEAIPLPVNVPRMHCAYADSREQVWIATTNDKVLAWNSHTNTFRRFDWPEDNDFGAGIEGTFLEDRKGRVWIKCRTGFAIYDPVTDSLAHYKPEDLTTPFYSTFSEHPNGQMWITSANGWIGRIDLTKPGFLAEKHVLGATGDGIITSQMDEHGILWCAKEYELLRFDTETKKVNVIPFNKPLITDGFNAMRYMRDGNLVFTARDHIVLFNTRSPLPGKSGLQPYLDEIHIRQQPLPSDTVAYRLKALHLKPSDNFFSFSFSATGPGLDSRHIFRYRLKGFQEEWTDTKTVRYANFTNVPSGQYLFELHLFDESNPDDVSTFTLPVTIGKPLLQRTWFRIAGILLLLAFVQSVYRYRIQQIRKEEKLKSDHEHQLASAETQALRAQMNPHFIFNSLNSIENFILKNDPEKASTYLNDFARLIRLILQNSRERQIPLRTELETLTLYLEMEALRFTEKFRYDIRVDAALDLDAIQIPPMLIQPYVENAIWHGIMPLGGDGQVDINVMRRDGMLHITVEDNGIGRERSAEINKRKNSGDKSSLGMTITQNRIELLNLLYKTQTRLEITDLKNANGEACGTRVDIAIPV